MEWKKEYSIGVEVVDKAHAQLFSIVRRIMGLVDGKNDEKSRFACIEGIKYFKSYAVKHFSEEEAYMISVNYDGYEKHRALHENLKNRVLPALEKELEESDYSMEAVQHFLGICIGWLTTHIMIEDKAITGEVDSSDVQIHAEEDISSMEASVNQIMQSVFGVEATLMSEHYDGWDIGKAIYFEFVYGSAAGEKWRSVMIVEQRLVFSGTGQMLGVQFSKTTELVLSAAKEISQMLMYQILGKMGISDKYKLVRSRLLSMNEAEKLYQAKMPKYSLLFNTKLGHMAFYIE